MQASSSTSLTLLALLQANDEAAWADFVQLYYPLVYRWCRKAGLKDHEVADVTQEVFQAVAMSVGAFRKDRPEDSFRGWLKGVTRHKVQDFWRNRQLENIAVGGTTANQRMDQLEAASSTKSDEDRSDLSTVAVRALDLVRQEFEEKSWEAARLVLVSDLTPEEVAEKLSMTRNAVYKAKARVVSRIREKLADLL